MSREDPIGVILRIFFLAGTGRILNGRGNSFSVKHICNHLVETIGVAHPVLTGDKPAEFHHDHYPVRYNYKYNNMDSLQFQTKLQHPLLDDFDQRLAGMT